MAWLRGRAIKRVKELEAERPKPKKDKRRKDTK
jgi:hypothetical protein